MKRWLLAALLSLAVVIFLAPGLIGLIAERSIEQQLEMNNARDPSQAVRELAFERGWFTSAGRHRLVAPDPDLNRLLLAFTPGAGMPAEPPALVIETRLLHGLVPFGAATGATLLPALATAESTLELELADGTLLPVPGVLYSRIGLTGGASFRYQLPPGGGSHDATRASWQGADVTVGSSNDGREVSVDAAFAGWRVENAAQRIEFAEARVSGNSEARRPGIAVGDASLQILDGAIDAGDEVNRWSRLDLTASSALRADVLDTSLALELLGFETSEGPSDLQLSVSLTELQADILGPLLLGIQYSFSNGNLPADEPYPGFEADVRRLLSSGANLNVDEIELRTPHGNAVAQVFLSLPAQDDVASWPGLLLGLTASADIQIDRSRVEATSPLTEQLRALVAGGFLVLDGEAYRLKAAYANGKATINGAPMGIPANMLR